MPTLAPAPSEKTDEELVVRAQADDAVAFRLLFDRYYPMIHAFCYRASLDQTQAQDIAQETFIKAARALGSYRGDSSFKAWLYGIARNAAHDWLRSKMRQNRVVEAAAEQWSGGATDCPPDYNRVAEALRALPDDLRMAIVLTYYEGMNHAEAAQVLGCAETTVSWRVFRAKRKLKTLLSREENLQ